MVAISALVMYAFLSRKAKAITDQMEQVGILFINRSVRKVEETPVTDEETVVVDAEPANA